MSFFRESKIEWAGEEHTFVPSMKLLMQIENAGISSEQISYAWTRGKVMKVAMAKFMGIVLRSAGIDVSDERLLQELEHNPENALGLFAQIRDALYTEPPESLRGESEKDGDGKKTSPPEE